MGSFPEIKFKLSEKETKEDLEITQFLYNVKSQNGKKKFEKFFSKLLNGDCWGLQINKETIFSNYYQMNSEDVDFTSYFHNKKEKTIDHDKINWNTIISNKIKYDYLSKNYKNILDDIYVYEIEGTKISVYISTGPARKVVLTYKNESWIIDSYIEIKDFVKI